MYINNKRIKLELITFIQVTVFKDLQKLVSQQQQENTRKEFKDTHQAGSIVQRYDYR
jgi:hypothetical protein